MRKISVLILLFFLGFSCSKKEIKIPSKTKKQNYFYIAGTIDNYNNFKAFLYQENNGRYQKSDSFLITNDHFWFKDTVTIPERAIIAFEKKTGQIPLILSNDSIAIKVTIKDLNATQIIGSKWTQELRLITKKSAEIYSEIDYLYPQFQKARLENDIKALKSISEKIKLIEAKNSAFLLSYAAKNPTSYIAPIILNDIIQKDTIITSKIKKIFTSFSSEVKQSKAAKAIALRLANSEN